MKMDLDMSAITSRLQKCSEEVQQKGTRKALRAGGKVIERAMYLKAPLLDAKTTGSNALPPGSLRDGMRTLVHENEEGITEAVVGPSAKVAHVARWVEYGHRQVSGGRSALQANGKTRGPGKASGKDVPAHPFLRPAFEESVDAAVVAERESLAETIQGAVR